MGMISSILVGVLSSFVASALFLFCLFRVRPKIVISPHIAVTTEPDGKKMYRLKIVNKTIRPIVNIHCRLLLSQPKNVPDGIMITSDRIPLKAEHVFEIPRYDIRNKEANYARRFVCDENIEAIWQGQDGSYLKFTVMASDSLSGFSKVFTKEFHTKKNCIVEGSHRFGDSLEILAV